MRIAMITGFGSFGETPQQECEGAGNIWTGEQPYPCVSPDHARGGAAASTAAALEQAKSYPGLFCSAAGGKYSWYGTCGCPSGDNNCKLLVKQSKINEVMGIPKPAAYAIAASLGLLGVAAFLKMRSAKPGKSAGMFGFARA